MEEKKSEKIERKNVGKWKEEELKEKWRNEGEIEGKGKEKGILFNI